jgi:hypothetical protein
VLFILMMQLIAWSNSSSGRLQGVKAAKDLLGIVKDGLLANVKD